VSFEQACPQALTLTVMPDTVRPVLPAGSTIPAALASVPTQALVTAHVQSCPAAPGSTPASVEVAFTVEPPAAGSAAAGGHAHDTRRPTGTLRRDGQPATSCLAPLDAEGLGACTLTYHPSEVSGGETITAQASGFPDAEAPVTVQVPGLVELPEDPGKYVRVGTPNNHAGTNDPCIPQASAPTSRHFEAHFGQPQLTAAIGAIAAKMLQETGIRLRVNDMSLPWGGLYDIGNNWSTPHRTHRLGFEADIGFTGIREGVCTAYDRKLLQFVIREATQNAPLIEANHFHAFMR
jgi:hypothetical protein